jgi:hypothetical protein
MRCQVDESTLIHAPHIAGQVDAKRYLGFSVLRIFNKLDDNSRLQVNRNVIPGRIDRRQQHVTCHL